MDSDTCSTAQHLEEGTSMHTMRAAPRRAEPYTEPAPIAWKRGERVTGRHFKAMSAEWLTIIGAADVIGVKASELAPFVQAWLRDPISGEPSRRVNGTERFHRANVLKLKAWVQPKPQVYFSVAEARRALGITERELRKRMMLTLIDWHYEEHGRIAVYLPLHSHLAGYTVPMAARRLESPCPSLCREVDWPAVEVARRRPAAVRVAGGAR